MKIVPLLGLCVLSMAAATGCSLLLEDGYSSGLDGGSSGASSGGPTPAGPWGRPAEGTYSYAVTGADHITGPFNLKTEYGPTASVTVRHKGASCYTLTLFVRKGYEDAMDLCVRGADVVSESGRRSQRFLGIAGAETQLTCAPGDVYLTHAPSPAQQWTHDCSGKNNDDRSGGSSFRTAGPYRFDRSDKIVVGGRELGVMHFHDERDVTGSQTGKNVADWYFSVDSGLLVRLTRDIDIEYGSFLGTVNYVETLDLTLKDPSPAPLPDAGAGADGAADPAK